MNWIHFQLGDNMNKIVLVIGIIGVLMLSGCLQNGDSNSESDKVTTTEKIDTVMDRYASFEASLGCALAEAGLKEDPNAVLEAMGRTEEFATKYGFTSEELTPLTEKYKEDPEFLKLVQEKMEEMCPETLAAIQE